MPAPTPAPKDSRAPSVAPHPGAERLGKAKPESTVTLMVQSGEAPGGLGAAPAAATTRSPMPPQPNLLMRVWRALVKRF